MSQNFKFWLGVCYLDEMCPDWQSKIDDLLQVPFAYGKHEVHYNSIVDHCLSHVHILLVFPFTTTFKHALSVFNFLSSDDSICCYHCEPVSSPSSALQYLSLHSHSLSYSNGFDLLIPIPPFN